MSIEITPITIPPIRVHMEKGLTSLMNLLVKKLSFESSLLKKPTQCMDE
jgi:hypothetical protein